MANILVIHHNLNIIGGAERVALAIIEALTLSGHQVHVLTVSKTRWEELKEYFGRPININDKAILPISSTNFEVYQRMLVTLTRYGDYDLIINSYGDIFTYSHIVYMHYPSIFNVKKELMETMDHRTKLIKSLYLSPYYISQKMLTGTYIKRMIVLTNSSFSAKAIKKIFNKKALIVPPPVDFELFFIKKSLSEKVNNLAVTVSRFNPIKKLETILYIAKTLPYIEFVIAGAVKNKVEMEYYKLLKEIILNKMIRNVNLLPNPSAKQLVDLYHNASIYIHTMPQEHFGIAVVEAMAAGCVPIVHKLSGTWIDVIEYGRFGYGFENTSELITILKKLVAEPPNEKFRQILQVKAQKYSKDAFIRKINAIVKKVLKEKSL